MYIYCLGMMSDEFRPEKYNFPVVILAVEVAPNHYKGGDESYSDIISALLRLEVPEENAHSVITIVKNEKIAYRYIDGFIVELDDTSLEVLMEKVKGDTGFFYTFGNYINHIRDYKLELIS